LAGVRALSLCIKIIWNTLSASRRARSVAVVPDDADAAAAGAAGAGVLWAQAAWTISAITATVAAGRPGEPQEDWAL
jgi:hypothetical protein